MLDFIASKLGITITLGGFLIFVLNALAGDFVASSVKKMFNLSAEKKKVKRDLIGIEILIWLMAIVIVSQVFDEEPAKSEQVINIQEDDVPTETEMYLEITKEALKEIHEISENRKRLKDSVIANKPQQWVYQIGIEKDNTEAIKEEYLRLSSIEGVDMGRFFVFKGGKKSYFIFNDNNYSEEQILGGLDSFSSVIDSIEPNVQIVNLVEQCSWKGGIVETKPLKFRKERLSIPCYECR